MRKIFLILMLAFCIAMSAQENASMFASYDTSLDRNEQIGDGLGGIIIRAPFEDLLVQVTSGNEEGETLSNGRASDGSYEFIVPINIEKGNEAHFVLTRRGHTEKVEFSEKRLCVGKLFGYRLQEVANPIRISPQPVTGDMYPSETEALVEIRTVFEGMTVQVPTAVPFVVNQGKQENDNSINVFSIVVPVAKIREYMEALEVKKKARDDYDDQLMASGNATQAQWDESDKMNAEVREMEALAASLGQIDIQVPNSNSLSIDNISTMKPREKLVVAVVPLVQTRVVEKFKNLYDNYMAQAQDAYENRKYGTAKKLYLQASQQDDITSLQASTAEECANSMDGLAQLLQTVKNCAVTWKRMQSEGTVQRHVAEECLELAMATLAQLYDRTHDSYYQRTRNNYEQKLRQFPVVIEGTLRVKDYGGGIMKISTLSNCDIYASASRKDNDGTLIGSVDSNGSFHVQFPRGQYIRLLLKPRANSALKHTREIRLINNGNTSMTIKNDFEP